MKAGSIVGGFFALAGLALAAVPGLPDCAQSCVNIPQGCNQVDYKCICSDRNFITSISCCVAKSCSASDQQRVITFASKLCGAAGVQVPTSATCPSTAPVTPAPAAQTGAAAANNTIIFAVVSTTTTTTTASMNGAGQYLPNALQAGGLAGALAGAAAWL